jgi:hypothetical protein
MRTLVIEWQRLLDENTKTCPRCGSTEQEVEKAAAILDRELRPFEINVSLVKRAIEPEAFVKDVLQSNKIVIAGKTLEEWLGARTGQSPCCEVCGEAECRTLEYADQTHETIPAALIVEAGLLAATQVFHVKLPQRKSAITLLSKKC